MVVARSVVETTQYYFVEHYHDSNLHQRHRWFMKTLITKHLQKNKSDLQITVYVGDITEEFAIKVLMIDNSATLIDCTNYSELASGSYYVSIGDLQSQDQLKAVLKQATDVVYLPPNCWSHPEMKQATEQCFIDLHGTITVHNFMSSIMRDLSLFLGLEDKRKTESPQLWSVGCSFTAGVGVLPNERYGQLLSDSLGLEVSFLAKSSSSIIWQADQILRSDIQSGDLLVWGLTALNRFPYVVDHQLVHANASPRAIDRVKHLVDIDMFDSEDLLYRTIVSIYQVINFCKQVNIKIILANLMSEKLPPYMQSFKEFIDLCGHKFIDVGSDGSHPGKQHHIFYCKQLLKKINELYPEVLLKY